MSKSDLMQHLARLAELRDTYDVEEGDILAFVRDYERALDTLTPDENGVCLATIVLCYKHVSVYWRGKPYLYRLTAIPDEAMATLGADTLADLWVAVAGYAKMVSDYVTALSCYEKAYTYRADEDTFYQMVVVNKLLNERYTPPYTREEIKARFPRQGERILRAADGLGYLKVDPVEHTPHFQAVFDRVHERMLERLAVEGNLKMALQQWHILAELYREEGIEWRTPATMNPRVRFD